MKIKVEHEVQSHKKTPEELKALAEEHGYSEYHKKNGQVVIILGCPPDGCVPCPPNC